MQPEIEKIKMQSVYLKDVSFESPKSRVSRVDGVAYNIEFETKANRLDHERFEIVLSGSVNCVGSDEETLFIVEVSQAGIFGLDSNVPDDVAKRLTLTDGADMLLPFLREEINSLVVKGGFQPLLITHMDFGELYAGS